MDATAVEGSTGLLQRMEKLGLACDSVSLDRLTPVLAALACFPMHMVANAHLWTGERQFQVPVLNLPGSEAVLEALELGRQEAAWEVGPEHRAVLAALQESPRPFDRVVYEYALATLKALLDAASPELADALRTGITRSAVAVANASGKGLMGTGEKVTAGERACLRLIDDVLDLRRSKAGAWLLERAGV